MPPNVFSLIKQLKTRPLACAALLILGVLYFLAIFAPFFAPYEISTQNLSQSLHPPCLIKFDKKGFYINCYEKDTATSKHKLNKEQRHAIEFFAKGYPYKLFGLIPSNRHFISLKSQDKKARLFLLGSDSLGRDIFSRLIYGARISLSIGFIGISITIVIGFIVGGLAGYFGGSFDFLAMRCVEILMAIPGLYLLLGLRSAFSSYFHSGQMYLAIITILSIIGWASTARIIRGLSLSLSERSFVLASVSMGQSTFNILRKHILPNITSYLLVAATLSIPSYILGEAALSFLGLGIQEPSSSWGLMLKEAQEIRVLILGYWWLLSPGALIFITVIAFNLLGDALRDIVDPKLYN